MGRSQFGLPMFNFEAPDNRGGSKIDFKQVTGKITEPEVEKATEKSSLQKAIDWVGRQIVDIREWKGRDGRTYASVTMSTAKPPSKEFATAQDVCQSLLDSFSGQNTYVSYDMNYDGKKATGRMLSVQADGSITFAMEVKFKPSNVIGGTQSFQPKAQKEVKAESVVINDEEAF